MKVEFDTTDYKRSHLKEPRGRGSWAFAFEIASKSWDNKNTVFSPSITYTEAKKWVRNELPNVNLFFVLS